MNSVISLVATIGCRYLLAFPSPWTKWASMKLSFTLACAFILFLNGCFLYVGLSTSAIDEQAMKQLAIQYDPSLADYIKESSFIFVPRETIENVASISFIILIVLCLLSVLIMVFFIFIVKKTQSITASKLQYSLIMSSVVQLLVTTVMLLMPPIVMYGAIAFDIPNSASTLCVCLWLLSSHGLAEFATTLYFVTPYRKFIEKLYFKAINRHSSTPETAQVSVAPNTVITVT